MEDGSKPTMRGSQLRTPQEGVKKKPAASLGLPTYLEKTIAGRYKIVKKLGEGGMGAVYLAEHVLIEKQVAIKILTTERSEEFLSRFAQEAKSASRIGHENIIDITDFGDTGDGAAFLCMEFLDGTDLGRTIRATGPQPIDRCVRVLLQVCSALEAAHKKGIVHRDLKPDNIFLVPRSGRPDFVKILDFGLARVTDVPAGQRLTAKGQILGTPEYMSPEQVRGDAVDGRTDVYAAGMVLYEMLTGNVPFKNMHYTAILGLQLQTDPPPPSKINGAITSALDAVVMKALAKKAEDRYQTMTDLAEALTAAAAMHLPKTVIASKPELPRSLSSSKWGWAALAGGILVVVGGLFWISRPPAAIQPPPIQPPPIQPPPIQPPPIQPPPAQIQPPPAPVQPAIVPSPAAHILVPAPPEKPKRRKSAKPPEVIRVPSELKDVFSDQ